MEAPHRATVAPGSTFEDGRAWRGARLQVSVTPGVNHGVSHGVSHPSSAGPISLTPSRGTDTHIAALDAGSRGME